MGKAAVTSHAKSDKHRDEVAAQKQVAAVSDEGNSSSSTVYCAQFAVPESTVYAEVRWLLHLVSQHQSFASCNDLSKRFAQMFPDSEVARNFKQGKTKAMYSIRFGLAPYFFAQLKEAVKMSEYYVLCFDESLNDILQSGQMDVHVRYWKDGKVCSGFIWSKFLGHAKAQDLHRPLWRYVTKSNSNRASYYKSEWTGRMLIGPFSVYS